MYENMHAPLGRQQYAESGLKWRHNLTLMFVYLSGCLLRITFTDN